MKGTFEVFESGNELWIRFDTKYTGFCIRLYGSGTYDFLEEQFKHHKRLVAEARIVKQKKALSSRKAKGKK